MAKGPEWRAEVKQVLREGWALAEQLTSLQEKLSECLCRVRVTSSTGRSCQMNPSQTFWRLLKERREKLLSLRGLGLVLRRRHWAL